MHWFTPRELRKLMVNVRLKVEREFYLRDLNNNGILPRNALFRVFRSGGFVFVGRKP